MRILLDQDEVLACWVDKVLNWYNQDYKTSWTVNDVTSYFGMDNLLGPQGRDFIRSCIRYPDFYQDLEPIPGAIEGVKSLINMGHDVCIVSAVPKCGAISYHGKLAWIRKYMPFFDLNNFVACSRKSLIQGDLLLDDAPHNVESFLNTGKRAALFDRPWNKNSIEYSVRIRGWSEFVNYVEDVEVMNNLIKGLE